MSNKLKLCFCALMTICTTACNTSAEIKAEPKYAYEDVEITGTVTKQYIEYYIEGRCTLRRNYITVIDYGGDYLKIVDSEKYYQRHSVGDEVTLVKHRTYDSNGKWIETKVGVK